MKKGKGKGKGKGNNNNSSRSMAALVLLETSPPMLAPWHQLSARALLNGGSAFEGAHGEDVWAYAASHPCHSKLINDAMACHARLAVSAMIQGCPEAFQGVGSLVDVGGGDGTALRSLLKACPWIQRGINLDLPHVVSDNIRDDGGDDDDDDDGGIEIEHVAGNMFEMVPKADAAFLMWVLHDWSDQECIQILSKCREAVIVMEEGGEGRGGNGKVMIAEAVIMDDDGVVGEKEEEEEDDKLRDVRLALDMVMLAHTHKGKERTIKEWEHVIKAAGFSSFTVNHLQSVVSLIQAYP